MALKPLDEAHALQIQAGTLGRNTGHAFEDSIAQRINGYCYPMQIRCLGTNHLFHGDPAYSLLNYISTQNNITSLRAAHAISTGALATSEDGKHWLSINGAGVSRCKSDLVVTVFTDAGEDLTIGISTKQCNNPTPTNAQLYFTTARGFSNLLRSNGIAVSDSALRALRQFCGDATFRPCDDPLVLGGRKTDPRRYFWEEIDSTGRNEWAAILSEHQDDITRLLLQKAYFEDIFVPDYVLHKTKRAASWDTTEVAIYSIEELTILSRTYQSFTTKPYSVRKGSYKDPVGVLHSAPRFGVVQMQRGGQQQHPEQLQFNLEAGYFYKI